jgi:glycosyltransferase involved in cell wall biosynthesis
MRILVINWQDLKNPLSGGAEVHLHEVFSRIVGRGHDVTVLCSRPVGAPAEEMVDGMHVLREGSRSLFNFAVPAKYRRIRSSGFDCVVEDLNKIPFFTPLFVREPLLGIGHHLFKTSIYRETNPVAASYVFGAEKLALRLYAAQRMPFIVNSPSTRDEFVGQGFRSEDITVVHLAVDHNLFRRTGVEKSPTPLIGCFGRLKRYKSLDVMLRALPLVLERVPELNVIIVGEGDDRPRLERTAHEVGVSQQVRFTGFVSNEEKVALLQKMWFKVATSVKEGWGLTVTEANACGTPVIASNVPGLRDAVRDGETGLLYPYGDVNALAASMLRLLEDASLRDRFTQNALAYASTFTWDAAAEQTLQVLNRVAESAGRK